MKPTIDLTQMDPILEKYAHRKDTLITMMQEIQNTYGYLPEDALKRLSREARVPLNRIYGIATFYSQFYLTPRGKHTVKICRGTACHVLGCESLVVAAEDQLGVKLGETTDDLKFTVESVACIGTCFLAPVMMVDDDYHGNLKAGSIKKVLKKYAKAQEK